MTGRAMCIHIRDGLDHRLDALARRIRAQGGLSDAGEFPSRTDVILELVERAEQELEAGTYNRQRRDSIEEEKPCPR